MTSEMLIRVIFWANIAAQTLMLVGVVWSVATPDRRIYPMKRRGFAFYVMWASFTYIFLSNAALVILDWNSGPWASSLRMCLGVPVAALGATFVGWGIWTLGVKNTSAIRDAFVVAGPYVLSRNPQYVGDIFLFLGVCIVANSEVVWITHLLTALLFLLAPFAEEPWLQDEYGEPYETYHRRVPRYL